jgi:hypothetical protein
MEEIAKFVLKSILAAIIFVFIMQFAAFFPFYITLVVETFNIANIASNDNYLKETYYSDSLERLKSMPVFNKESENIKIEVIGEEGQSAIGLDDMAFYNSYEGEYDKPYRQRGKKITVTISAVYVFDFTLWKNTNRTLSLTIPNNVSFSVTTAGTKYYKDLEM